MKNSKLLICILLVACIASVCFMIYTLTYIPNKKETIEFVPPDFEMNIHSGKPDAHEKYGWSEVYQNGMNYKFGINSNIIMDKDNNADIYFYNDEENAVWLKLRILDVDGNIISESGIIKPNAYIEKVHFLRTLDNGEKIKIKIMAYQPETYYSEGSVTLNTNVKSED